MTVVAKSTKSSLSTHATFFLCAAITCIVTLKTRWKKLLQTCRNLESLKAVIEVDEYPNIAICVVMVDAHKLSQKFKILVAWQPVNTDDESQ